METSKLTFRTENQSPEQKPVYGLDDDIVGRQQANTGHQGSQINNREDQTNVELPESSRENSKTMATSEDHSKKLPNELLLEVFGYLADVDAAPPSVVNFSLEPSVRLTRSIDQPLKTLSLVCQRWRNILLPDVFKHVCVTLDPLPRWLCLCTSLERQIKRRGQRGRSRHADQVIQTIHARMDMSPDRAVASKYPESPMDLEYVKDDEKDLLSLPREFLHWLPSVRGLVNNFLGFIVEKGLQSEVKSLVLQAHQELTPHLAVVEETIIVREVNMLWRTFFETLNPPRVVIAAPASTMAALTSSREGPADTWAFEMPLHYLSFSTDETEIEESTSSSRPSSSDSTTVLTSQSSAKPRIQTCPQNLRPWTQMSYNEGTMLPGYAHYEWQWKRPPCVLPYLLYSMRRAQKCARTPKLQKFTYISIFPYSDHVAKVMENLRHFKTIHILNVKFAEPDYLDDATRLGKGQSSDVWMEWSAAYKEITEVYLREVEYGVVFESVDAERAGMRKTISKILEKGVLKRGHVGGPEFMRRNALGEEGEDEHGMAKGFVRWVRAEDPMGWGRNA